MTRKFPAFILVTILPALSAVASGLPRAPRAQLAQTPPMGWNDWYQYGCKVTAAAVRANAQAMVQSGMKAVGYTYVNIDDCWQGQRDAQGFIHPNSRFPNMKSLSDYIHGLGLKFGIYSSPGPKTCAGYEGSYGHEVQDAETYARWGVDFVKYDWCSARKVYKPDQMQAAYLKMYQAIQSTGRPMVFSLCQYGLDAVWQWGSSVGGNMWRTTNDIGGDGYDRVTLYGFEQNGLERFAGPGHWNDPDILQIGIGKPNQNEEVTQMTLWCLLAAPLLAGNDLTNMTEATRAILTNPELIAVDQDAKGTEGRRAWQQGPLEIWVKPLSGGATAVGFFNRSLSPLAMTAHFKQLGLPETAKVRDLWARKNLGVFRRSYTVRVPADGAALVKIN